MAQKLIWTEKASGDIEAIACTGALVMISQLVTFFRMLLPDVTL